MAEEQSSSGKRKTEEGKTEAPEKKHKTEPTDAISREAEKLAKALEENEKKEPLPGVTFKKLIHLLNLTPLVHTQGESKVLWDRLCETAEGRQILFFLYKALVEEHTHFVSAIEDYSRSASLSLDDLERHTDADMIHSPDLEDAQSYVGDIEKAAKEITGDVYQAQVFAVTGDSRLDKSG